MSKRIILPQEDDRIVLRLLEKEDLPLTLSWRNRDENRKWFFTTEIITEDKHYAWFERYKDLDNDFVFVIQAKDLDNNLIGQVALYGIDWDAQSGEYGRLVIGHMAARRKGYARNATRLVMTIGFEQLGLSKIFLEVKEGNLPAIAVYKACGFKELERKGGLIKMVSNKLP